jgi:hypothetical protein
MALRSGSDHGVRLVSLHCGHMSQALSILLTNVWLSNRAGTEIVVRDLATGLLRRGHRPIVYSPELGEVAEELTSRGIVVIDDLRKLAEPPDIIHAHHSIPCGEALIRFPQVPAVYVCHAFAFWMEGPVHFPQIAAYVAVDETCRDRLVQAEGIDPTRVVVLHNAVDLTRIPARQHPILERPTRAIAFGKAAAVPELRQACQALNIEFHAIGHEIGRVIAHPEQELVKFDLVFGSARAALEGLCCGCAVIACDTRGIAGLVTSSNFDALRAKNFGLRTLGEPVTVDRCIKEIRRYDRTDAINVSEKARRVADLERLLDAWEKLHADVVERFHGSPIAPEAHSNAMARFLHENLPRRPSDTRWPWMSQQEDMQQHIHTLESRQAELGERLATTEQAAARERGELESRLAELGERLETERASARAHREVALAESCDRIAEAGHELNRVQSARDAILRDLINLKRSRLLRIGRFLRRVTGRPIPY